MLYLWECYNNTVNLLSYLIWRWAKIKSLWKQIHYLPSVQQLILNYQSPHVTTLCLTFEAILPLQGNITCYNFLLWKLVKGKAIPLQAWAVHEGSREVGAPRFQENRHMKMVRLSALRTGHLYPQEIFLVLISVRS